MSRKKFELHAKRRPIIWMSLVTFAVILGAVFWLLRQPQGGSLDVTLPTEVQAAEINVSELPLNADRSFQYLQSICDLGRLLISVNSLNGS